MTGKRARRGDSSLEHTLWLAANRLRHHLDAAAYKHVVLGLVFLRAALAAAHARAPPGAIGHVPQDISTAALAAANARALPRAIGHVPQDISTAALAAANAPAPVPAAISTRWADLVAAADGPDIGARLDAALVELERADPGLAGVSAPRFERSGLDPRCLGELVALLDDGDAAAADRDVLGRVYEYFLAEFAGAEGKKGGQFYTPRGVVELLVDMLAPARGRVYDPCCGSGGMFVHSARVAAADLCLFGQESNPTTWRLARMNLAIHGLRSDLGEGPADTLQRDLHPDLRAEFILANPPFNASAWGDPRPDDPRWRFGCPPARSANFAWVQHVLHHLAPTGAAGVVLACGSLSSRRFGEAQIRRAIVEADLLDCVVALPPQLFYATAIPACLWLFAADRRGGDGRDRRGEVLFIDARQLGAMTTRTRRELARPEIARIAHTYRTWRTDALAPVPGFSRPAALAEIARHDFMLTPGRYVGAAAPPAPSEDGAARMRRLARTLDAQLDAAAALDREIRRIVRALDHA